MAVGCFAQFSEELLPLSAGEFPDNVQHDHEISSIVIFSCVLVTGWIRTAYSSELLFVTYVPAHLPSRVV